MSTSPLLRDDVRPAGGPVLAPAPTARRPRRSWIWAWRLGGTALVAALVVSGTLGVITQFFVRETRSGATVTDAVTALRVATGDGDITITRAAPGQPAAVVLHRKAAFRQTRATQRVVGHQLVVETGCSGLWPFSDPCRVDVVVAVPAGVTLDLTSSTGAVTVEGATGDVVVKTASGDVRLVGVTSRRVSARSTVGSVTLDFAAPPQDVTAAAPNSSVAVTVPDDGTNYRVDTTGDATPDIGVPDDPASQRTITATTSTGTISIRTAREPGHT